MYLWDLCCSALGTKKSQSLVAVAAKSLQSCLTLCNPIDGSPPGSPVYKVNSLIKKGYLVRQNSTTDRREYHLVLSEKYYHYMELLTSYELTVVNRMKERFSAEDVAKLNEMLEIISNELMPECSEP